ncbi:MAG: aminotransferase class I/II-fold pyridoxal phosphate-dependent enzyme [Planctomycetota bacterium]|jgi:aspartate/methionine/tyrosine aminotransferase|nr:aminotransferase class I/II-fold pyridoxal phosphate-dependent enzyme [Planctomycetota bacterium]
MFKLADRVSRIDASGIRRIFDLARSMKDPINLSIGQPDFAVPDPVKDAAVAAIRDNRNSYTPTQGIAELNEQLRAEEERFTGRSYAADELLITSGVSGGLFLALLALIDEGCEVVIPDPYFVMYKHLVALFGGVPVYLDTYDDGFGIDPHKLEALLTDKTRLVLLNSPCNPTGRILDKATLEGIAAVCRKRGVPVLSDEIYRSFAYEPMTPMAAVYEHTVTLGGHSKAFGMTGWRLGFASGPRELIQAMAKVQQYSFVCAPSIAQYAALACPQVDMSAHIDAYRAKRDLMAGILSQRFELGAPDGAFYLYVKAPDGFTGDTFVEHAIKNNILIIPGSVFSERDSHFRICYTVADDILRTGAERLCDLADLAD